MSVTTICLLGFGEVGALLAHDLASRATIAAWDTRFADSGSPPSLAVAPRIAMSADPTVSAPVSGPGQR